jgi:pimeloyl-ACP methyl ester carboxylesterase
VPPDPEQDYSGAGYSACVAAVVQELELRHAVIVGWSLGGHAVLDAAQSLPSAAGLMIFGTPPIGRTSDGFSSFKTLSPTVLPRRQAMRRSMP